MLKVPDDQIPLHNHAELKNLTINGELIDNKTLGVISTMHTTSQIARLSGDEGAYREYISETAERYSLSEVYTDKANNMAVHIPATQGRDGEKPIIIQGHQDIIKMIDDKDGKVLDPGTANLSFSQKEDLIFTTNFEKNSGLDNGVGCSAMIELMRGRNFSHGPIILLFTADEERGLIGASEVDREALRIPEGCMLINTDSPDGVEYPVEGASGTQIHESKKIEGLETETLAPGKQLIEFELDTTTPGHSGLLLDGGRLNAIQEGANFIAWLESETEYKFDLVNLSGGEAPGVVPTACKINLLSQDQNFDQGELEDLIASFLTDKGFSGEEPKASISANVSTSIKNTNVFSEASKNKVLNAVQNTVHGKIDAEDVYNPLEIPLSPGSAWHGRMLTTANLTADRPGDSNLKTTTRFFSESDRAKTVDALVENIASELITKADVDFWLETNPSSELRARVAQVVKMITGNDIVSRAISGSIEPNVLQKTLNPSGMISIGPILLDLHGKTERAKTSTIQDFVRVLRGLLEVPEAA